jgi:outer membrane lipoprotein-sorting protein
MYLRRRLRVGSRPKRLLDGGLVCAVLVLAVSAAALTPEERGREVFVEQHKRTLGYQDYQVGIRMVLRGANGDSSERLLRISQLEVPDDGDKLLVVFDTPKAIKGTALLSFGHKVEPDDQWLYLPALKRVKRIASRNKSGPFLGSEFAFEDLSSQEVEKYDYRFLREETLNGITCYVVERYPRDEYSGYTRQVVWVDKDEFRVHRVDYYDRKPELLKTLTIEGYRLYADAYWKPSRMFMQNHQTGKTTELYWEEYRFRTGLSDERDFTTNSLKRVY